jgi:hypothetical protein
MDGTLAKIQGPSERMLATVRGKLVFSYFSGPVQKHSGSETLLGRFKNIPVRKLAPLMGGEGIRVIQSFRVVGVRDELLCA